MLDEASQALLKTGLVDLGLETPQIKIDKLVLFLVLMQKWNKVYNLSAIRQVKDMVNLHILDSLSVMPFLRGHHVADIGTGAGLPGIPLAIYRPELSFVLLDSNAKKTRFVQQVILELGLKNVEIYQGRVETYLPRQRFDTVITRAFSDLKSIWSIALPLLTPTGIVLAMKGARPDAEINALANCQVEVHTFGVPGINAKRCLVSLTTTN
ncbi:MAG: 16S rRNA (guanine(527)-N(7))-methyltransferase RsmG [Methylococcaceae bacterium]